MNNIMKVDNEKLKVIEEEYSLKFKQLRNVCQKAMTQAKKMAESNRLRKNKLRCGQVSN